MSTRPSRLPSSVHVVTLEGARLGVARVRHPTTGVQCLAFSGPDGSQVALVPREAVTSVRKRLWQFTAIDGRAYTLGPIDLAVLRRLAG